MRLDKYLFEKSLVKSRSQAAEFIRDGKIFCDGKKVLKPSFEVDDDVSVEIIGNDCSYVSRGALKLIHALDEFGVVPSGAVCVDVGASTGGFTEVLIKRGASFVYAVDSGHGQLDDSLAADSRVKSLEGLNARFITSEVLGEKVDIAVCDVSFISQTFIHGAVSSLLKENGVFIGLIKPQFELSKSDLSKGGIVREAKKRLNAVKRVMRSLEETGFVVTGFTISPITGGDGNIEFLVKANKSGAGVKVSDDLIERIVLNENRHCSAKR